MIKKFVLTAFATLIASMIALAQTQPAPGATTPPASKTERAGTAKSTKDADKAQHAEERSKGAAFSGKGKGKDKNTVDKDKKGKKEKKKGKGKGKGKHKGKGKSKRDKDKSDENSGDVKKGQKSRQPAEQKRRQESSGGEKAPAPATPEPSQQKSRKAGDKPTPGAENPKGR